MGLNDKDCFATKLQCRWFVTDSSEAFIYFFVCLFLFFFIIVGFVIHWNESAMDLHVFPIPIPPPTSLSTQSL